MGMCACARVCMCVWQGRKTELVSQSPAFIAVDSLNLHVQQLWGQTSVYFLMSLTSQMGIQLSMIMKKYFRLLQL